MDEILNSDSKNDNAASFQLHNLYNTSPFPVEKIVFSNLIGAKQLFFIKYIIQMFNCSTSLFFICSQCFSLTFESISIPSYLIVLNY